MSTLLRSLKLMVGADFSQAQAGFKQAAKEFKAVGKDLTQTGSTLTKGVTMPIAAAAIASIKFASDLEESTNKVNVAFGDSADEVKKFADSSLKNFGIAKGSAMDMAATYGDMGTSMGLTSAKAAEMSTSLTGLAGDLASFKNIGLDQASEALRGVFTGEGEALKSLGVVMLDSTLQAYALAQGITTAYKDMSQAEKVALRYKYVMDATKNAQGDFQRTSGGVANQMRTVTEGLKEAAASLGTELLPKVASALQGLNGLISKFTGLDKSTKSTIIAIAGVAAVIGPTILVIGKLNTGLGNLSLKLADASKALASGGGLTGAFSAFAGPGGIAVIAVTAIAALAAGMIYLNEKAHAADRELADMRSEMAKTAAAFETTKSEILQTSTTATDLADKLYNLADKENKTNDEKAEMIRLTSMLNKLMPDLNLKINEQTGELDKNRKAIAELIEQKSKQLEMAAHEDRILGLYKERGVLVEKMTTAMDDLTVAQKNLTDAQARGQAAGFLPIQNAFKDAQKRVQGLSNDLWANQLALDNTKRAMAGLPPILKDIGDKSKFTSEELAAGNALMTGRAKHLENLRKLSLEDAADYQKEMERWAKEEEKILLDHYNKLEDEAQEHMSQMGSIEENGIKQSQLTAAQVKKNLEKQLADYAKWRAGIKALAGRVPEDVLQEIAALGPGFTRLISGDGKKDKGLVGMTDKALADWVKVWRDKAGAAESAALYELGSLPGEMTGIGRDAGEGLARGLRQTENQILLAAAKIGKAIPYNIRKLLDEHSPSKVMMDIGKNAVMGMAIGIRDNVGLVKAASAEMSNAAMSTPLQGRAIEPRVTGMETVMPNIMNAVSAGGGGGDVSLVINVGGKTVLDTVLTEAQRRNARSGRQVIAVGV